MVLWLLGISGAGKSTLGQLLYDQMKSLNKKVYLIDGDEIRSFFESDLGYSKEDRIANIKRIIYAAYVLSKSGVTVIVCNISPFEQLREFTRRKVPGYVEIYLKKKLEISIQSDVKDIYKENLGKTEIIGKEIAFEEPKASDLVIEVDTITVFESFNQIISKIKDLGYFN
jgi:adenylylsulfate kinase